MKKLLILTSVFLMLVISAGITMAGSVYLDYMPGEWELKVDEDDGDSPGTIIGFEHNFDRFKFGLEYGSFEWEDLLDADYKGFDLKGGYQLNDQFAFTIGYHRYQQDYHINGDDYYGDLESTISGVMIGIDGVFPISDKATICGSLSASINGKIKGEYREEDNDTGEEYYFKSTEDVDIITAKIKFNYEIANNLDVSLGYRYTSYDSNDDELKLSGVTLGLAYKFSGNSQIIKPDKKDDTQTAKTLILKNDLHGTEYSLIVNHRGKVKIDDTIELTAEQVKEVKNTLSGPYHVSSDGEMGIRSAVWHKLGNVEVRLQDVVKYDKSGKVLEASLIVVEIR